MSYQSSYTWQAYGSIPDLSFLQIHVKCILDAKHITYLLDKTVLISIRLSLEVRNGSVKKCNKIQQALCPEVSTECRGNLKEEGVSSRWVGQGRSES